MIVKLSSIRITLFISKFDFIGQETTLYGATVKIHEPVGVIGMACPDSYPLLGFVSLFAPAVVRGNTMVIIPSQNYPLSALDLYQVMLTTLTMYCLHRHQYYKT